MKAIITLIVLILTTSCNQSVVKKLLRSEVLKLHRNKALNFDQAELIDSLGHSLTSDIDFDKEVVYEFFTDESGEIAQMMELPIETFEDELFVIQMRLIPRFDSNVYLHPFSCDSAAVSLRDAGILDQQIRRGEVDMNIEEVNIRNQRLVVSSIENCGFPSMEEYGKTTLASVWIIIQHASNELMAYYFQDLESAALNDELDMWKLGMTLDRLLMYNGYPQVYGTQNREGELYDLRNPSEINKRRLSIGLPPFDNWELENIVGLDVD